MRNDYERLIQHSPYAGTLVEETVSGTTNGYLSPENDVDAGCGADRSMFVFVPKGGCPHPKQTQVLFALRNEATRESAEEIVFRLGLDKLAEDRHFVVVLPNPIEGGWNFVADGNREDDASFVVRCFAALKGSKSGVAAFNGMIYYLACDSESSAMVATLAVTRPLDAAAIMVGAFPQGYELPVGAGAEQVAWLYHENAELLEHLASVDQLGEGVSEDGVTCFTSTLHPLVQVFQGTGMLDAAEVARAWECMFSTCRRWRNDTFGIYQPRIDFTGLGFVAHTDDTSLGLADGLGRTWNEYVPERVRNSAEPAPLVIYCHGINCCGTYGAEQSGWDAIARRDGLMCLFPDATAEMRWNVWDDPRLPLDMDFILALIDHMDTVHPVDRSRVYISGFSMGSMFTNALAAAHPDVFAGAIALNGPDMGYLQTLDASAPSLRFIGQHKLTDAMPSSENPYSPTHVEAAEAKERFDFRIPFVQFVGALDGVGLGRGHAWPLDGADDGMWPDTVALWKSYDASDSGELFDASTPTGLAADVTEHVGERFWYQTWRSADGGEPSYYHFFMAERMPHAVDLREIELGWQIVSQWRRLPDGRLERV
jgi:poly(3-hydroxybutyrate) depolymerase